MALVGPGSIQNDDIVPSPTLDGASEFEYVTILNPLSDDFQIAVAQDIPVDMPFQIRKDGNTSTITNSEQDARQVYGLGLKNPDHPSFKRQIMNNAIIPAGKSVNLKGNEAQVAVRQLVNEILQREGKTLLMSNPKLRKEVEDRIIIGRGSVQELMDSQLRSTSSQVNEAINASNEENNEQSFAKLNLGSSEPDSPADGQAGDAADPQAKRGRGRPSTAKSPATADSH